jgi:hypothetical protein
MKLSFASLRSNPTSFAMPCATWGIDPLERLHTPIYACWHVAVATCHEGELPTELVKSKAVFAAFEAG